MKAIQTEHLTKQYKDLTAVDDLNLTVEQGELFSLLLFNCKFVLQLSLSIYLLLGSGLV